MIRKNPVEYSEWTTIFLESVYVSVWLISVNVLYILSFQVRMERKVWQVTTISLAQGETLQG